MRCASTPMRIILILKSRFRWVACQLDLLGDCFSVRHLRQALASLPNTLDDTYARILLNIDKQHNHYHREVLKILQWLSFSSRPLQLEELAEIVAIDINETPRFDPERRWPESQDILMICSSLVTLTTDFHEANEEDNSSGFNLFDMERACMTYIRLAHFSVKEYLVSDRIQHGIAARYSIRDIESHGVLAGDCIAYLLQYDRPDSLTSETLEFFPLTRYAAEYWINHAREAQKGPVKTAASLSMELLMSGEGGLLNWVRIADPDPNGRMDLTFRTECLASPLYYASLAGLSEPVNKMIEKNMDVNAEGGWYGNALQAACNLGSTGIVHALVDNGAEIDAMGALGTALCAFCYAGNYEIAELLLNKGADVDAYREREFCIGNSLQIASKSGCENIVKLLLDRGAAVNATSTQNCASPLQHASLRGYENIVKMLLEKGANINAKSPEDHYNALQLASLMGHKNVVKMLLENGADVNVTSLQGRCTALQLASRRGYENIVMMLLDRGADVNATSHEASRNALQLASLQGHENVVKMLLQRGADVNATSPREPGNALQLALREGHKKIVEMLLENGADVNGQGGDLGTALQGASDNGNETVVTMLLKKGADVNATCPKEPHTALQLASWRGYENIVTILLERGADVNATSPGACRSALQLATKRGHKNIVMMLVEKGAVMPEGESETSEEEYETSEEEHKRKKMKLETSKAKKISVRPRKALKTPSPT